uniref:Uncharacterized protein n=1 Tax=Meloidogyne incognita TaxID=6306 RepID=A0A914MGQ5_MELIC
MCVERPSTRAEITFPRAESERVDNIIVYLFSSSVQIIHTIESEQFGRVCAIN